MGTDVGSSDNGGGGGSGGKGGGGGYESFDIGCCGSV